MLNECSGGPWGGGRYEVGRSSGSNTAKAWSSDFIPKVSPLNSMGIQ